MDNQDDLEESCATCHKQESRHTEILGNAFKIQYFEAIWSSLNKGLQFYPTRSNAVILYDTLSAEVLWESDMHED